MTANHKVRKVLKEAVMA